MKYLIDTHTLLWAITDESELPQAVAEVLSLPDKNDIFVSTVSVWEIAIKTSVGKLSLENFDMFRLQEYCEDLGFSILKLDAQPAAVCVVPQGLSEGSYRIRIVTQLTTGKLQRKDARSFLHETPLTVA